MILKLNIENGLSNNNNKVIMFLSDDIFNSNNDMDYIYKLISKRYGIDRKKNNFTLNNKDGYAILPTENIQIIKELNKDEEILVSKVFVNNDKSNNISKKRKYESSSSSNESSSESSSSSKSSSSKSSSSESSSSESSSSESSSSESSSSESDNNSKRDKKINNNNNNQKIRNNSNSSNISVSNQFGKLNSNNDINSKITPIKQPQKRIRQFEDNQISNFLNSIQQSSLDKDLQQKHPQIQPEKSQNHSTPNKNKKNSNNSNNNNNISFSNDFSNDYVSNFSYNISYKNIDEFLIEEQKLLNKDLDEKKKQLQKKLDNNNITTIASSPNSKSPINSTNNYSDNNSMKKLNKRQQNKRYQDYSITNILNSINGNNSNTDNILNKDYSNFQDLASPKVNDKIAFQKNILLNYNLEISDYIEGTVESIDEDDNVYIRIDPCYSESSFLENECFEEDGALCLPLKSLINPKLIK